MSKTVEASIECRQCGHSKNAVLFRTLWTEDSENRALLLNDRVNVFVCDNCDYTERLEFPFLCTNVNKGLAIWYEPYHDPQIDADIEMYRQHMGANSFYAKAPRMADWNAFKARFLEMEAAGPQQGQEAIASKEIQQSVRGFVDSLKEKNDAGRRDISKPRPTIRHLAFGPSDVDGVTRAVNAFKTAGLRADTSIDQMAGGIVRLVFEHPTRDGSLVVFDIHKLARSGWFGDKTHWVVQLWSKQPGADAPQQHGCVAGKTQADALSAAEVDMKHGFRSVTSFAVSATNY
jgi:hypothetical protein